MPKPVHPKYEDWTPPWGADDETFDAEKAKRLIYGLQGDKLALTSKLEDSTADIAARQAKLDEIARKDETETERLKRENEELKAQAAKASNDDDPVLRALRLEVALDKGLTKADARRLVGTTTEELEQDADDLLKSFGRTGKAPDDDGDKPAGDEGSLRRQPRRLLNGADPDPQAGKEISTEQALTSGLIRRI